MGRIRNEVEAGSEAIQASAASVQNASDWASNLIAALMSNRGIDVRVVRREGSSRDHFAINISIPKAPDDAT
jgi:regulation of enolase protein 1 (concanavalin A-like superfamily)